MNGNLPQEVKDSIEALVAYQTFDQEFMSKVNTKTVYSVSYHYIEKLINKHYGEAAGFNDSFELAPLEERGSGSGDDWDISIKKEKISDYESEYITPDGKSRYRHYSTRAFLTDLCNKGIIPEGNYLIDISW
jgi:hypothetical protein